MTGERQVDRLLRTHGEIPDADVFEPFGEVTSVTLVTEKETGRRVGFGFVGMPAKDEALSAINGLEGTSLKGQMLEFQNSRARFERRQQSERRDVIRETPERRVQDRRNA